MVSRAISRAYPRRDMRSRVRARAELSLLDFMAARCGSLEQLRHHLITVDFDGLVRKAKRPSTALCDENVDISPSSRSAPRATRVRRHRQRMSTFATQQRQTLQLPSSSLFSDFCDHIVDVCAQL